MKKNFESLYENLGGTYREENGHLIPDIALPEQTNYQIGKYERMHLDYIKQHRRGRYTTLLTEGKLNARLHEIDLEANEMLTGGFLIYGYKIENKKVVIDEETTEVVHYIFEQYSLGVYVKDIIANLTARGILNRGKPFARNTVYNILKNEKYSGIYRYGDEVFENMYPQIVPQEIFDRVRSKINANKYGKRSVEVVYLLRHKLKCDTVASQSAQKRVHPRREPKSATTNASVESTGTNAPNQLCERM